MYGLFGPGRGGGSDERLPCIVSQIRLGSENGLETRIPLSQKNSLGRPRSGYLGGKDTVNTF